ncbi:LacI family DNA-binding transcriptional regulator [Demequina litorisediminis]|uniref:Transcriptional regulator LacI/GalR-like sensor domain-containing protein n=1 Tax=Demequina litorisediminis TaxID=1849022 RepID=A0ABQ6IDQ1_9MICO|nr:substrate-binding domain-containing protein [Demequina litorisediminis]GMA35475.1 hypothetical protein GCM10025876_16790 [Demequina litorisediminis]
MHVTTYPEHEAGASRRYLAQFNANLNDGLLLSLAEHETLEPSAFDVDYPLVCLGTRTTHGRADKVATDDVADGHAAARFLYSRGATALAVVGAHVPFDPEEIAGANEGNAEMRLRGIHAASVETGRRIDPRLVGVTGYDWTIGSGFRGAQAVIAAGVPFDAMVCLNDGLAIGAISALREAGFRVPEDVQVIGFDDIEESAFLSPPLTTMDSRLEWIVPTALDRLAARIDQDASEPVDLRARSQLVERGTTR